MLWGRGKPEQRKNLACWHGGREGKGVIFKLGSLIEVRDFHKDYRR